MKKVVYSILMLMLPFAFMAAMLPGPVNAVSKAMGDGNASEVAKFFDSSVRISILDDEGTYSKSQGSEVLKRFFSNNRPTDFTVKHNGNSAGGDEFFIGDLQSGARTYLVYVYFKQSGSEYTIKEISIETD